MYRLTKTYSLFCLLAFTLLMGCSSYNVYRSSPASSLNHSRVAILPFEYLLVSGFTKGGYDLEKQQALEETRGIEIQQFMYKTLTEYIEKRNLTIDIKDTAMTNSLLKDRGLHGKELVRYPKDELCAILRVDDIIYGRIRDARPVSDAENVARTLTWGLHSMRPSSTETFVYLYNQEQQNTVWKFQAKSNSKNPFLYLSTVVEKLPYQ